MKIKHVSWRGNLIEFTIKEAVEDATTPNAYSYDGKIEGLEQEIEKLRELVARLVESIYNGEKIAMCDTERLRSILGYGYEVEDDKR